MMPRQLTCSDVDGATDDDEMDGDEFDVSVNTNIFKKITQ